MSRDFESSTLAYTSGPVPILKRRPSDAAAGWQEYAPVIVDDLVRGIMEQVDADVPAPPANAAIRFAEPGP